MKLPFERFQSQVALARELTAQALRDTFAVSPEAAQKAASTVLAEPKKETKTGRPKRMAFFLKDGAAWNPLRQYPRNKGCFCGSGTKFKKCCEPILQKTVPKESADYILENWDLFLEGRITTKRPGAAR